MALYLRASLTEPMTTHEIVILVVILSLRAVKMVLAYSLHRLFSRKFLTSPVALAAQLVPYLGLACTVWNSRLASVATVCVRSTFTCTLRESRLGPEPPPNEALTTTAPTAAVIVSPTINPDPPRADGEGGGGLADLALRGRRGLFFIFSGYHLPSRSL